jgi:hypothetical protein
MTIHPINVGKGDLRWAAFVKHASPWISIPVDSGTAGVDSILVWADPSGLAPGVYLDTVVVEAIAGTGTLAVPVYFRITQPVATQLRFLQQPSTTTAGGAVVPTQVGAFDALGNVVTSFNGAINLSIVPDTGGASVGGTTTVAAVAGVATFSNWGIHTAGCYKLIVSSTGLQPDTSTTFCITPGPATALAFKVSPAVAAVSCGEGLALAALQVAVVDAFGNVVVSDSRQVDVALGSNPGGGTLSGTTSMAAVAGVATFLDLTIDRAVYGYTLVATAAGLTSVTSAPFGAPLDACWYHLVFWVQPTNTAVGAPITPPIVVCALDAADNIDTQFTGVVTITIAANPGGGTLGGTASALAVAGCATFPNLSIDKAGSGYTLAALSATTPGAVSTAFTIGP